MQCICFRIAEQISLEVFRRFFNLPAKKQRDDHLLIEGRPLTEILLYPPESRQIWLFPFGCLVLVDFARDEVPAVMRQIQQIMPDADYSAVLTGSEYITIEQLDIEDPAIRAAARLILPELMARSVGFHDLELRLNDLLANEEFFIDKLRRNQRWLRIGYSRRTTREITLFQFSALHRVRLLDLPEIGQKGDRYQAARIISDYYEMADRKTVYNQKMDQLTKLAKEYTSSRLDATMLNFYWLEVVLLSMFPFLDLAQPGHVLSSWIDQLRHWLSVLIR